MNRGDGGNDRQEDDTDRKLTAQERLFRLQSQQDAKSDESDEKYDKPRRAPYAVTDTLTSKPSPSTTPGSGLKLGGAKRPYTSTRKAQSLDELEASAEAVRKKGLNVEEQQREMGIIYSRRKRVKQKLKAEALEEKKNAYMEDNARLRRENAELETMLLNAQAEVNVIERRAARRFDAMITYGTMNVTPQYPLSGSSWNYPSASRLPFPHSMSAMPQAAPTPLSGHHRLSYFPGHTAAAAATSPPNFYGAASAANNNDRSASVSSNPLWPYVNAPAAAFATGTAQLQQRSPARAGLTAPYAATASEGGSFAAGVTAQAAGGLTTPSLPEMRINPMMLRMHFLGQMVIPEVEERMDDVPVSELQELLHYWTMESPDAAAQLDHYLRRRLQRHW